MSVCLSSDFLYLNKQQYAVIMQQTNVGCTSKSISLPITIGYLCWLKHHGSLLVGHGWMDRSRLSDAITVQFVHGWIFGSFFQCCRSIAMASISSFQCCRSRWIFRPLGSFVNVVAVVECRSSPLSSVDPVLSKL